MRKLIIALLMTATVATPVLAQRGEERAARQQARSERQAARQAANVQRQQVQVQTQQQAPAQLDREALARQPGRWRAPGYRTQAQVNAGDPVQYQGQRAARQDFRAERRDDRRDFRSERRDDRRDFRNGQYPNRDAFRADRRGDRQDFRRDRADDRRDYRRDNRQWNREWRSDRRYDWQRYRQSNRSFYRLPRYYAPRDWGYGYRRFGLGIYLNNSLFARNYWISDPWYYRLPPAEYGYQWVRYYNDVMLVDVESGYVVDVIYDFFL